MIIALARENQKRKLKTSLDTDTTPYWDAEGNSSGKAARNEDGGYLSALEEEGIPILGIERGGFGSRTVISSLSSPKSNGVLFTW